MKDTDKIGRTAPNRGKKNGNARLVEEDVHDIRRRVSIARTYNVSRQAIYNIKIGADWGWLPEEP
jgi:hypothetical protein